MSTTQPMTLIDCDYKVAARRLRCDEASIRAVRDVESRGAGFLYDTDDKIWRIKILFERHIMYRLLEKSLAVMKRLHMFALPPMWLTLVVVAIVVATLSTTD